MNRVIAGLVLTVCAALALGAAPANAEFGVSVFDGGTSEAPPPSETNPYVSGPAYTQAGGHPYEAWTAFEMNRVTRPDGALRSDGGNFRNVDVDLPPGLIGNPTAVPQCPKTRRIAVDTVDAANGDPEELCPAESVVGLALLTFGGSTSQPEDQPVAVFNLEPPPGVAAQFGFAFQGAQAFIDARLRADGEYAVSLRVRNANESISLLGVRVGLWGNPSDPRHDTQRCIVLPPLPTTFAYPSCNPPFGGAPGTPTGPNPFPTDLPKKALLTLPTACTPPGVGLETRMRLEAWDPAVPQAKASFVSHLPPAYPSPQADWGPPQGPTGCDQLPFDPSFNAQPDSLAPDAASGLTVDLGFPQDGFDDPEGLSTAHLRDAKVTLPEGMTINPSGADGLVACTDAQVGFNSVSPVNCPEASKVASVTATTPVLEEQLTGSVYVASQLSDDPESGNMFRLILALENRQRGIFVKLLGKVRADRETGRLETSFEGNPQLPVSALSLHFKDGPRAPLATPASCGAKSVQAELSSWGGQRVTRSDSFNITCTPDLGGFAPLFSAGTLNATGGAFSPFAVRITRPDRQQYLNGLTLDLPTGMLARLRGVPQCPEANANAGTCGAESRVGTATVGSGAGGDPFFLKGSVSLTGPYKGAPFGLVASVRVVAGPFDLGTVVVRQALFVDPVDAHVTVVSDPLPTIVKGVPVRLRSLNVDIDRPGFTLNPTSCEPKQINATLSSPQGATRAVSQPFKVNGCAALPLRPRLGLSLTGRRQLVDGRHPGLRAVLTQPAGQSNLEQVGVKLPLSLALDPERAQSDDLCEFEAGQRVDCPESSIIGQARAFTPVLNRPLTGPVYFVKNIRIEPGTGRQIRTLPTLLITLRGEVAINLRAKSSVERGKLVNTFETVPDAPVSRFELNLDGGREGILVVNGSACQRDRVADVRIDGHSGRRADSAVRLKAPCVKRKRARLRAGKVRWRGRKLQVRGRMARVARKRVRVAIRCAGGGRSSRLANPKRGKGGRFRTTVKLRGRCANARRGRVILRYSGGPRVKRATYSRKVRKRG